MQSRAPHMKMDVWMPTMQSMFSQLLPNYLSAIGIKLAHRHIQQKQSQKFELSIFFTITNVIELLVRSITHVMFPAGPRGRRNLAPSWQQNRSGFPAADDFRNSVGDQVDQTVSTVEISSHFPWIPPAGSSANLLPSLGNL